MRDVNKLISEIRTHNGTAKSRFYSYIERQELRAKEYLVRYYLYKAELRDNRVISEAEKLEKLEKAYGNYIEMREDIEILKNFILV